MYIASGFSMYPRACAENGRVLSKASQRRRPCEMDGEEFKKTCSYQRFSFLAATPPAKRPRLLSPPLDF